MDFKFVLMKDNMHYDAYPLIFKRAEELRNRLTPSEELLWNYLREGQLGIKFRRQHPASNYILDFYAHKVKLAIELDGSIHNLEEVKRNDNERQAHLESFGISFLRFTNEEIFTKLDFVMKKIESTIERLSNHPLGARGFEIIPAIDIIDGKCVRLTQGDYSKKTVYNANPLELAKQFEDIGIERLHLVDLDGAKKGEVVNYKVLERIALSTNLIVDFGGGIKTNEAIRVVFESGASIATVGSVAVKNRELFYSWINKFGVDKILLGADVKEEKIVISGWLEKTDILIFDFVEENMKQGINTVFCTDISKDGLLKGASVDLYKKIIQQCPDLNLIASGGVASLKDLDQLKSIGCSGAIVGKAIYEGRISMNDLKKYIAC